MKYLFTMLALIGITAAFVPSSASAYASADQSAAVLAGSNLCVQEFSEAERRYGIPKHLLMAIANTESGRFNPQVGRVVPWPWTLNVEGQGAYFKTMHDAMTAVRRAQQQGKQSIDVGCMQISLKHHPDAFETLLDAMNPAMNVQYAAKFLRQNYDDLNSWPEAIAAYHSRTPSRGNPYYAMVRQRWQDVRSNAGGNMLENSDYMVAGVRVTRLPISVAAQEVASNPLNSEFDIAMRDTDSFVRPSTAKIITRGNAKPMNRKSGQHFNSMKVITVAAEDTSRDAAIVTVNQVSQRLSSTDTVETLADATPPAASYKSGPNWIFGHE